MKGVQLVERISVMLAAPDKNSSEVECQSRPGGRLCRSGGLGYPGFPEAPLGSVDFRPGPAVTQAVPVYETPKSCKVEECRHFRFEGDLI